MATASVLPFPTISLTATPQLPPLQAGPSRRRTTPTQGRALEVLGHAIEYLVDSRLLEGGLTEEESQAVRILMSHSRTIFDECATVLPVHHRVQQWVQGRFGMQSRLQRR